MNTADIVLIILIAAALILALRSVIKGSGKCSCGRECSCCASRCKRQEARGKNL